jgi:hypothetical protein
MGPQEQFLRVGIARRFPHGEQRRDQARPAAAVWPRAAPSFTDPSSYFIGDDPYKMYREASEWKCRPRLGTAAGARAELRVARLADHQLVHLQPRAVDLVRRRLVHVAWRNTNEIA